jgi:phenylacetate-CoA ligase
MLNRLAELIQLQRQRRLPSARLEQLRLAKLRSVARHAMENVPFYRELYRSAGVRPDEIRTLEDLRCLPLVRRKDIQAAGAEAVAPASERSGPRLARETSGYSGQPLVVWLSRAERRRRLLREFRALLSLGFRPLDRLAVLGPGLAEPRGWHERLGLFRTEVIPPTQPLDSQIRRLQALDPTILWAYPTALRAVAGHVQWRLRPLIRPRVVISSSQVLDPLTRDRIQTELEAEMFVMYASIEVGRIAVECRTHSGLHVEADAVIVEILDGDRPAAPGSTGQVVVTSLDNTTMPFIRYVLGDLCAGIGPSCCCGCAFPLIQAPQGRDADMVRLPGGAWVSAGVLDYALRGAGWIEHYRFIQEHPGRIALLLVARPRPEQAALDALRQRLRNSLEEPVDFDLRLVDEIPSGGFKFKTFVSRL